jgi:Polyketide cyclase / dehydrase and lipid transport
MREVLNKQLPTRLACWTIAAFMVLMYALLSANWLLALAVVLVAALGPMADVWWTRRRYPARMVRLEESGFLPWPSEVVWDLIKPAEKAPLIDPGTVRAHHVAGTPSGLGEQQAHERLDGSVVVLEVIEYEHGRRAVMRVVSPPGNAHHRAIQAVEPTNGGCIHTMAGETDLRAGQRILPAVEAAWRANLQQQITRIDLFLAAMHGNAAAPHESAIDQPPLLAPSDWPAPDT